MSTLFVDEGPEELQEWLARRKALGQDLHDEVWEGVYHVAPYAPEHHGLVQGELMLAVGPLAKALGLHPTVGFNLGTGKLDFRVPDGGCVAVRTGALYVPTAVLVIEVLSPHDETWQKVDFYRQHGVQEMLVAHPEENWVRCYDLVGTEGIPEPSERSRCLDVSMADLEAAIDWPAEDDG